jgi:hypothetical protein
MHLHAPRNFRSDFDALLETTADGQTASRPSNLSWIDSLLAGSTAFLLDRPFLWIDSLLAGSTARLFAQMTPRGYVLDKDRRCGRAQKPSLSKPPARRLSASGSGQLALGTGQWAVGSGQWAVGSELDSPPAHGQGSPALKQVWKDWGAAAERAAAVQRKRLTAGGQEAAPRFSG